MRTDSTEGREMMDTLPIGVNKITLPSGTIRYRAIYNKGTTKRQQNFNTLKEAICQREEWVKEFGHTTWGEKPDSNMIGKKFGKLTVVDYHGSRDGYGTLWLCKCDCGNEKVLRGDHLRGGKTKSCGCLFEQEIKNISNLGRQTLFDNRIDGVELERFSNKVSSANSTGFRGVDLDKRTGSYRARITVKGQEYALYGFKTAKDAYYNGRLALEQRHLPKRKD